MENHYKVLGVTRNASKDEIKQAYRKLAMEYHPDKHAISPQHLRDAATLKFKQLSHAYDILIDDQKRADYNIRTRSSNSYSNGYGNTSNRGGYYNHGYGYSGGGGGAANGYGYGYSGAASAANGGVRAGGFGSRMEMFLRFFGSRTFLLNAAAIGLLLGSSYFIDAGGQTLWDIKNSGKSFEEAMESIEKAKSPKR